MKVTKFKSGKYTVIEQGSGVYLYPLGDEIEDEFEINKPKDLRKIMKKKDKQAIKELEKHRVHK